VNPSRILLVDDEPMVHEALRRALRAEHWGWELCFAGGVDEALRRLEEHEIDVVVSDVRMPEKTGFDLLAELRRCPRTADLPVIILTGLKEYDLKRRALDLGATDLLTKPVDAEDLIARIRSALRLKSYQDQLKTHNELLERIVQERTAELARSRLDILWRLGKIAEFRDEATGNHVVRVGCYCRVLGEVLGLDRQRVEMLFLASPLHDIGKIGIPDHILLKCEALTPAEWAIMQRHCKIGERILREQSKTMKTFLLWRQDATGVPLPASDNPLLDLAATIALTHHERWDGTGYPAGLRGEEIPFESRIVALADSYDALGSDRPYHPALPEETVCEILRSETGTHFDPRVYTAFEKAYERLRTIRAELSDQSTSLVAQVCGL